MPWQKIIAAGETVGLKLSAAERKLIVACLYVMDGGLQERIRQAAQNQDVQFTLDELEDLHGNLAFDANHADDRKHERALDKILRKIERLLDFYSEAPQAEEDAPRPNPKSSAVPMICGSSEVPGEFRQVYLELVSLTDEFCNERLNLEYQGLCRDMAISICQPESPVLRGKRASWASGIVYAVGWVNFLGDPSQKPHVRSEEIAEWFGVSTATMHSKAKAIREGLGLIALDPDFTLPSRIEENPLIWMVQLKNGLIVDIRHAPREAQVAAYERGLIPYIPADRESPGKNDDD
jgi:ribosomal protein S15P/S13E